MYAAYHPVSNSADPPPPRHACAQLPRDTRADATAAAAVAQERAVMAAVSNSNILGMLGQFVDVVKKAQIPNFVVVALGAPIIRGFSPGPSGRALTLLVLTSLAGAVAV